MYKTVVKTVRMSFLGIVVHVFSACSFVSKSDCPVLSSVRVVHVRGFSSFIRASASTWRSCISSVGTL